MDDLSGKINQLLSDPASMEKIKNLAGMLSNSSGGQSDDAAEQDGGEEENGGDMQFDPEMLLKMQKAISFMKQDDPRVDLLIALKKNLSVTRQKKCDEAIHILRLLSLMPMLREQGLFKI